MSMDENTRNNILLLLCLCLFMLIWYALVQYRARIYLNDFFVLFRAFSHVSLGHLAKNIILTVVIGFIISKFIRTHYIISFFVISYLINTFIFYVLEPDVIGFSFITASFSGLVMVLLMINSSRFLNNRLNIRKRTYIIYFLASISVIYLKIIDMILYFGVENIYYDSIFSILIYGLSKSSQISLMGHTLGFICGIIIVLILYFFNFQMLKTKN